jgi:hypothetical protein
MGRIVLIAALVLAPASRAEEVEVKYASVPTSAMKRVRRIEVEPSYVENLLVQPWEMPYAQLVARKVAPNKAALELLRVEVVVVGDKLSIRLGELVNGVLQSLPGGSRIDLVVHVPARLMQPRRQPTPDGPADVGGVAMRLN